MIVIDNKYEIGDIVYLKTDSDQFIRIVTSIRVYKNGDVTYGLGCGTEDSAHYDFEISYDKNITLTT